MTPTKINKIMKRIFLVITIISLVFTACKKEEGCTDFAATNYNADAEEDNGSCKYNLSLNFTHTVDGNALETDTMIYTNQIGQNYSVQTLRYLLSDITLHSVKGASTLLDEVHFITLSDPSTFNLDIQDINSSNYTAISFTMGLDSLKNITDNYLNESFFPSFAWPDFMGGGYHYMQLEGDYTTAFQGYATHTGGTDGLDFSFTKNFPIALNIANANKTIIINMEINNWYSNTINLTTDGIMDNADKQALLQANGIADVFSVFYTIN